MIRPAAPSIENIIRGKMQEGNPTGRGHEGKVAWPKGVGPICGLGFLLGLVYRIIRGGVEHQVGGLRCNGLTHGLKLGDIKLLPVTGDNLVPADACLNGVAQLTTVRP